MILTACEPRRVTLFLKFGNCINCMLLWHDVSIRCVGVGKCHSEDPFVCFGAKPTQRACAWYLLRYLRKTREVRSQGEQRRRQNRAFDRRGQSTEVGRSRQSREEDRRRQSAGERWWLLVCVVSNAGSANLRRLVSIPGSFVGISLEYTLAIAHRMLGKCHELLLSCAWN